MSVFMGLWELLRLRTGVNGAAREVIEGLDQPRPQVSPLLFAGNQGELLAASIECPVRTHGLPAALMFSEELLA
jgi:hypothetical protein